MRFFHHNLSKSSWLRSHVFYIRKDEVQDEVREHIWEQHLSSAFDGGLGSVHTHDHLAVPDLGADLVPGQVHKALRCAAFSPRSRLQSLHRFDTLWVRE